jgi:hypothetical protein
MLLTIRSSALEADEIFEILQFDERDHFFVAGLSFWPPKSALAAEFLKAGTQSVAFGVAKPDLVEITRGQDDTITWKVIDAKASQAMKVLHTVNFYILILILQQFPRLVISYRSTSIRHVCLYYYQIHSAHQVKQPFGCHRLVASFYSLPLWNT